MLTPAQSPDESNKDSEQCASCLRSTDARQHTARLSDTDAKDPTGAGHFASKCTGERQHSGQGALTKGTLTRYDISKDSCTNSLTTSRLASIFATNPTGATAD